MSEDPLLRELGQLAREEKERSRARFDERWDRLAAGTLSPEEEAELRASADASPEGREAYEAFRPLGADFQSRLVDRLSSEIEAGAPTAEPRGRLLSFPRWQRTLRWAAGVAVAAAALVLFLRAPGSSPTSPLPVYVAELSGGIRTFRGGEGPSTGRQVFHPGRRFQVVLRPATETEGRGLEAECFLVGGAEARRIETQAQVDPGGAVKIEGSIGRGLQPGDWTLWAVVGRKGELPGPTDSRFSTVRAAIRQRDWVAVPTEIRIQSRSP
jgi:hypothetical protein